MDMHASHLRLPREEPIEQTASPAPVPPPPEAADSPSLWRALPAFVSQRKAFCATTALAVCGVAGVLTVGMLQPGPAEFGLSVDAPAVAATAPVSPTLDRYGVLPAAPQPVVSLGDAPVPVVAPVAALPAPVPVVTVPPRAEPDPLAEQRQLLQQVTAPIATTVTPPAPNEEVGKLAAMVTSVSAMLGESLKSQIALRREVAQLQADLRAAQADANSRIAFIEARVNVAATQSVAAGAAPAAPQRQAPAPVSRSANATTTYRITGAASNLAYLVAVNPAPGQPPAVEAKPGGDVPGYGKVLSITQKGTAWEIVTERGSITN